MQNDTGFSLYELGRGGAGSLARRVLRMQAFEELRDKAPMRRCVQVSHANLQRHHLDNGPPIELVHYHSDHYIAVSCPWAVPGHEAISGRYAFSPADQPGILMPQDAILNRVLNFKVCNREFQNNPFWLDKLCISQDEGDEKELAVHSMDLVYRNSRVTLGLLFLPITSLDQLRALRDLLTGRLAEDGEDGPALLVGVDDVEPALQVIEWILQDDWWHRAWIFQEEFLTFRGLRLLIPCALDRSSLAKESGGTDLFGSTTGEIEVSAIDFRTATTTLALALTRRGDEVDPERLAHILRFAGRYASLYRAGSLVGPRFVVHAMSPSIFEDVGSRGVTIPSDILAIAANCCGYVARLNAKALDEARESLSVAILALFLMNGEILRFGSSEDILGKNIFDCLRGERLHVEPPISTRELVLIKNCRLILKKMTTEGLVVRGAVSEVQTWVQVEVSDDEVNQYWERDNPESFDRLNAGERRLLHTLARQLKDGHKGLANLIEQFLSTVGTGKGLRHWSREHIQLIMSKAVCRAMARRQRLWLARPLHMHACFGIIVRDGLDEELVPTFTFTSLGETEYMDRGSKLARRSTKVASLEVERPLDEKDQIVPKKWINGLFFYPHQNIQMHWTIPWPGWMQETLG